MSTTQTAAETAGSLALKATPPTVVSGASLFGIPVNEWVLWATFIYTVLMAIKLVWQSVREAKSKPPVAIARCTENPPRGCPYSEK